MSIFKRNDDFVANLLYKSAVEEEKEWRKEKENAHDKAVTDRLLKEIRELGYKYKYFADITNRDNTDEKLLKLLSGYIGQFNNDYFSASLVGVIGKKGNTWATEIILNNYNALSEHSKHKESVFYDNALARIKDKRYLQNYLDFLKTPEVAVKLPFTMIMLGKWKTEAAKPYFFEYLDNTDDRYLNTPICFISVEALSYYDDPDGAILKALEDRLNTDDKNLISATNKAIKRLKKRNGHLE